MASLVPLLSNRPADVFLNVGGELTIPLAAGTFSEAQLTKFEGALANGDPLPDWLRIDLHTGVITILHPTTPGTIDVLITAVTDGGRSAPAVQTINVTSTPVVLNLMPDRAYAITSNFTFGIDGQTFGYESAINDVYALNFSAGIDSLTAGTSPAFGARYADFMMASLRYLYGDGGSGYESFTRGAAAEYFSGRFTSLADSTAASGLERYSLDGRGVDIVGADGRDSYVWRPQSAWDTATVYYLQQPGGGTLTIHGAGASSPVFVDTSGPLTLRSVTIHSDRGQAIGTLSMDSIVGHVTAFGADFTLDGGGASFSNFAIGGTTLSDWSRMDRDFRREWFSVLTPEHFIFNGGMNDRGRISGDEYRSLLIQLLDDIAIASPSTRIILVAPNAVDPALESNLATYRQILSEEAVARDLLYIDDSRVLGTYAAAVAAGYMDDAIHPSILGNSVRADTLLELFGVDFRNLTPSPTSFLANPHVGWSYTATLIDGGVLPSWLSFDTVSGQFRANNAIAGDYQITVTARTPDGQTVSDSFNLHAAGQVFLQGTASNDVLRGDVANDNLFGRAGQDILFGSGGNDVLDGGAGPDALNGGAGLDTASYVNSVGGAYVNLATGIGQGADAQGDTFISIENVTGSLAAANTLVGDALDNVLTGGNADDSLIGGLGRDTLRGGAGSDILDSGGGSVGAEQLIGGTGDDTYIVHAPNDAVVELAGEGFDTVRANLNFTLPAQVEALVLLGTGALVGTGNGLDNVITGNGANNILTGFEGNDTLDGGGGDDYLSGGGATDILIGGAGADTMYGGADADRFVFRSFSDFGLAPALDVIGDFSSSQGDKIDLSLIGSFSWLGLGEFTGHARELRYAISTNGTLVSVDINGDRTADFQFVLQGQSFLSASDFPFAPDIIAPTLSITVSSPDLSLGETTTVTFSFSEAASGFKVDDIVATHGAFSNFTMVNGAFYTATFTPTPNYAGSDTIAVAAGSYSDIAGNAGDGSQFDVAINTIPPDILPPALSISLSDVDLSLGETATVTFSFSEAVGGFTIDDIVASYGVFSNFTMVNGAFYTATFTPAANYAGSDTIVVAAGSYSDVVGNAGDGDQIDVAINTIPPDILPPALSILISDADLSLSETATVTISFSEAVSGFAIDDIVAGRGAFSNFTMVNGAFYTATFTPSPNYVGIDSVIVAAGSYTDLAGNGGLNAWTGLTINTYPGIAGTTFKGGISNDQIRGTTGNDTLLGFAGNDQLNGSTGADLMIGGSGNDIYIVDNVSDLAFEDIDEGYDAINSLVTYRISANIEDLHMLGMSTIDGTGNDLANIINGNDATNTLFGLGGGDTLRGGGGNDTLDGGEGNDYLSGGTGADVLIGGSGTDTMYGGADADRFVFQSVVDFGPASAMDLIGDFSSVQGDRIDLSALGSFSWLGIGAFTGQAGELHYAKGSGGTWVISADLNGDRTADFQFALYGQALNSADFALS